MDVMTRALTALLIVASLALAGAAVGLAQGPFAQGPLPGGGRDARPQASGSAVIRGRVLAADSGTPIRRAQVRAVSPETRVSRLATTDAQGRFEFRDLPAGRWQITASKAGFVTLRYGQRRPFEAGRPLEVRDAQVLEGAELALPRGAAVTGRVFDEFGDAVAGARVQVLRYQVVQGSRRLTPTGVVDQSDDTGAFRLFGLTPGDYYLSATLRALPVDDPTSDAAGYAPTYYPGTGNVAEAQRISLAIGQELSNISFALLPVRTVRVSGQVIDSTGKPLTGGFVMLESAEGSDDQPFMFGNGGGGVRGDGTFTVTNVAPGRYTLTVSSRMRGRRGGAEDDDGEVASMPLTIGNEDLSGVYVATTRGATLSGTVVAAPGSSGTLPAGIQISAQPVPAGRALFSRPARIESSGAFTLTGLHGPRMLVVGGLSQDWMLDSITLNGSVVTDRVLEFAGGQELRGARVVVTDRVTELSGSVMSGSEAARDYTVVVFPDDETKWTFPSRYLRAARPDQQGLFKLRGLPPDDRYLAVAVDYLEEGEGGDPQFLQQIREQATRFGIGPGESKAIDLKLVAR
jgi:protocatechuate 3,4-dioxygenase beta subunit